SSDGKTVLTSSHDRTARLWDADTGKPRGGPLQHPAEVQCADLSPDGKTVVTVGDSIRMWDVVTGRVKIIAEGNLRVVCFSPDAKTFLTGTWYDGAAMWDAPTGGLLHRLAHPDLVRAAAYRRDGAECLTGCDDGKARRWDVATGRPVGELLTHGG